MRLRVRESEGERHCKRVGTCRILNSAIDVKAVAGSSEFPVYAMYTPNEATAIRVGSRLNRKPSPAISSCVRATNLASGRLSASICSAAYPPSHSIIKRQYSEESSAVK